MRTNQQVFFGDSRDMSRVKSESVNLVVTSPPYPMIEMWDDVFASCDESIKGVIAREAGWEAFEKMHRILDDVWRECFRVLAPGGFACINIGNATRSMNGDFCFYPNNGRILNAMVKLGMTPLPDILWRKPTNAPNKFMGSGMLPAGAYVTYEHEYIMMFRKGGKRVFSHEEKIRRSESAYFWEERNIWFSDLWYDVKGVKQVIDSEARERSAAFPLEIPYRLISMYSIYGDTVLDPFGGLGTTLITSAMTGRNGILFEKDEGLKKYIDQNIGTMPIFGKKTILNRLDKHCDFVRERINLGKNIEHKSLYYKFPVVTRQECDIKFYLPKMIKNQLNTYLIDYIFLDYMATTQASLEGVDILSIFGEV